MTKTYLSIVGHTVYLEIAVYKPIATRILSTFYMPTRSRVTLPLNASWF